MAERGGGEEQRDSSVVDGRGEDERDGARERRREWVCECDAVWRAAGRWMGERRSADWVDDVRGDELDVRLIRGRARRARRRAEQACVCECGQSIGQRDVWSVGRPGWG